MKVQITYSSFNFLCFSSGIRGLIGVRLFCSFRQPSRRFELVQFDSFKHFLTFSWRVVFFYGITTFLWTLPIKKNKGLKVTFFEKWWQKASPSSSPHRLWAKLLELVELGSFKHFLPYVWQVIFINGITTFLWTLPINIIRWFAGSLG